MYFAVIFALPALIPLTTPFEETVHTDFLEEVNLTLLEETPFNLSVKLLPLYIFFFVYDSFGTILNVVFLLPLKLDPLAFIVTVAVPTFLLFEYVTL